MLYQNRIQVTKLLPALILAGSIAVSAAWAQSSNPAEISPATDPGHRYRPTRLPKRAGKYYGLIWGVDSLSVRSTESGALIRFSYHVLDPNKAKALNQKETEAVLNVPSRHIQLVIPSLEKVGKLRQTSDPESDRSYWMAFSNPHRTVKPGDRVEVVIGAFRADGLIVE